MNNLADATSGIMSLEERIETITDLYNRFQSLRQIPPALLRPPVTPDLSSSLVSLRPDISNLKEVGELIRSDKVQEALRVARASEKADKSELNSNSRRKCRKRRRPPSPESPQPYVSFQPKTTSMFPTSTDDPAPLQLDGLSEYIRDFNQKNANKMHIWTPNKNTRKLGNPVVIRFVIPDVLTAFITLSYDDFNPALIIETVTAFGPRECKPPHRQSDYIAYQNLSQQIAQMVQSHPRVSFQSLVGLLCSYSGIFVDRCMTCQRVLSIEGHLPPVGRIWVDTPGNVNEKGLWHPRHANCLRR